MIIARYFLVGGAAAAVDFTIFAILVKLLGWHWFGASALSFVLATAVNYVLSITFVFTSGARFGKRTEIGLVFLVSAMGLAMNQFALWMFFKQLGVDVLIAKVLATGVVFFWNFGIRRYFIFSHRRSVQND
ncbi:MAG: GtrA family protein [Xanthomonadales bacterium]|nr:GtrA family protein [Xanthomonadales bacterium]